MSPNRNAYTDMITRWLKAHKDHPGINHGAEPDPADYGFTNEMELWEAEQIKKAAKKELNRTT